MATASFAVTGIGINAYASEAKGNNNSTSRETTEVDETETTANGLLDISEIADRQAEQQVAGSVVNEPLDNAVPVIYNYEILDGDAIQPGEEFTIKFTVYNPAVVSKIGNIRVEVTQEDNLLYPGYGKTNSLYMGYLNALSYTEGEITLTASKDINTNELPVIFTLKYTDNYYPHNEQRLEALLPVSTVGKLAVDSIDMPSAMYVGSNNRLRIVYRNDGLSTINNVTLHIQGDYIENQEVYLGSIGNNTSMTSDAYVTLLQQGTQEIQMYFTYTDSYGSEHETDTEEYELDVRSGEESSNEENEYIQGRIRLNRQMTYGVLIVSVLVLLNLIIRISLQVKREKKA